MSLTFSSHLHAPKQFSAQKFFHTFNATSYRKIYPKFMLARHRSIDLWKIRCHRPSNAPPLTPPCTIAAIVGATNSFSNDILDISESIFEEISTVQASTCPHVPPKGFVRHLRVFMVFHEPSGSYHAPTRISNSPHAHPCIGHLLVHVIHAPHAHQTLSRGTRFRRPHP